MSPALSLKIRNLLNQKKSRLNKIANSPLASVKTRTKTAPATITSSSFSGTNSPTTSSSSATSQNILGFSSFSSFSSRVNSDSSETNPSSATGQPADTKLFDDACKPDLTCFMAISAAAGGYGDDQMRSNFQFEYANCTPFFSNFDKILLADTLEESAAATSTASNHHHQNQNHYQQIPAGLEHMKVERQISASLYAMNGVSEYWENIHHDCSNNDSFFWDLPLVSQMFCPS